MMKRRSDGGVTLLPMVRAHKVLLAAARAVAGPL